MNRERINGWCERGILGLVLAILVYGPLALGAVRPSEFVVIEALTVGVLCLWLVRLWANPKHRLLMPPICWGVLAFVIYALIRYAQADIEYVARQELIRILIYAFLFFAILSNLHLQYTTRAIAMTLLVLATLISIYALYQKLTNSEYVWHFIKPESYLKRGTGTYICPNHLAGFLEMLLPLAIAYAITGRYNAVTKVLIGYTGLAMMTGIVVSMSRGGWAAMFISLLVLFGCLLKHRDFRLSAGICLAVLIGGAGLFLFKSVQAKDRLNMALITGNDRDIRFRIWPPAWHMWQDHPLLGVGPAHFDYRYRAYREEHDKMQTRPGRVHNDYLNTLADWGLVGCALVALPWALLGFGVFRTWPYIRRSPHDFAKKRSNKSAFVLGSSVGLIAILVHSFVDFNLHIPANAILAVTLMALISGHLRFATERFWITPNRPGKLLASVILLAGIVYLGLAARQLAREHTLLRQAAASPEQSQQKLDVLKAAFAVEPKNFETAHDIGELLRLWSWRGDDNYQVAGQEALAWFQRSIALNPYFGYSYMRHGMLLHWLDRHAEDGPYFKRAIELDPNGYYTRAHIGWHYFQLGDYPQAQEWFIKSKNVNWVNNPIAQNYLQLIEEKLKEAPPPK